jgi:hypothetical protein
MEPVKEKPDRVGAVTRLLPFVFLPLTALMLAALGLAYLSDIPVTDLLRDPSAVLDGPWYVGIFSTTGIALWASTGAMCLLALSADPAKSARSLLVAGAVISFVLGADDGYLLHETIKNEIGIPSPVTIGLYGLMAILLLRPAWSFMTARADFSVFLVAVVLFAVSAILDGAAEAGLPTIPFAPILEDIAKFLGIATWLAYFAGVASDVIRDRSPVTASTV